MTDVRIIAGTLTASREDRAATGLLLPFGEVGRTNLGRFRVEAGAVALPTDPIIVTLNIEHDRERPVGRAVTLSETDEGIVATFTIAETEDGDDVLNGIEDGTRRSLSAEVAEVVIRDGVAVSGRLFGAAACETGAFPSATVYASDVGDLPEDSGASAPVTTEDSQEVDAVSVATTADGATLDAEAVTITQDAEVVTTYDDGSTVETITEVSHDEVTYETQPASGDQQQDPGAAQASEQDADAATAAEEDPEDVVEASSTAQEETTVTTDTLTASAPAGSLAARTRTPAAAGGRTLYAARPAADVYAHLAQAFRDGGKGALYAALSDVVPADVLGVGQPDYLGELWSGRAYRSRVVDLFSEGPLTARKMTGWRWVTKPAFEDYAGNKGAVPSAALETEEATVEADRIAVGHDVDRIFADFGEAEFFDAYFRAITESYARVLDARVYTAVETAAADVTVGAVPSGVSAGWAAVVDGALAVNDIGTPSFALVASDLWRDMLLTRNDDALAMLNAALGLDEGEALTPGRFALRTYSGVAAGTVLVGCREAATVHQPPGKSPIRVDALDLANGGVDKAAFGYYAVNVHAAEGLALVSTEESSA